ncbi:MAG: hypothetical protein CL791_05415 [Chloroflexi bacterium]|nr:hypothetical protein [Chloroflexota bacterium]
MRRNQLIIAGISTVLLVLLWSNRNFTGVMKFALPFLIISLWIPPIFVQTQHDRGVRSNFLIGLLGIVVACFVVRAIWLIGRG